MINNVKSSQVRSSVDIIIVSENVKERLYSSYICETDHYFFDVGPRKVKFVDGLSPPNRG